MKTRCRLNGDQTETIYENVVVYRFRVYYHEHGDCKEQFHKFFQLWQDSERGWFVMERTLIKPVIHERYLAEMDGYDFCVTVELLEQHLSEFYLRWGKPND